MAQHSKFLEILKNNSPFLESKFVKGAEDSELPPVGDEEAPEQPESGEEMQDQPEDGGDFQPEQDIPSDFTDREQDILNVAVQIYRSNPENPIEYKNEFSDMIKSGDYENLLSRLISIADELTD